MSAQAPVPTPSPTLYWICTGLLAFGMFAGGLAQTLHLKFNVAGMLHLGYPEYLLSILGPWKMLGVVAILLPGFPLLKEWAYAGLFFAMTGGVLSHLAAGDTFLQWLPVFTFAVLTGLSWYLRPASRRLPATFRPVVATTY